MSLATDIPGPPLDVELIVRAQGGELAAFDALISTRLDRCYRIAWTILRDAADAADATQDACVQAWRSLPQLRDPAAFDGWLNRIVANSARNLQRGHKRRVVEIAFPEDSDPPRMGGRGGSDEPAEIREIAEADVIIRAFERLTEAQRVLLLLHHVEHAPMNAIARSLDIPVGTAKSRLHAARQALQAALRAES